MFNVGDIVYTIDTMTDGSGNLLRRFIGSHQIFSIYIDQSDTIYEFVANNQIFKARENQVAKSFEEMVMKVESSHSNLRVCNRCGVIFKAGEGFEIQGLNLCLDCLEAVKEKLSADSAEPEISRCECGCGSEKCDCEKCECDMEATVGTGDEVAEGSR